ncbi:MAG: ABC transporter substrate-binding protein [Burkholderiaceae bacterium]|nr:ABC transporter substrate-binding protein [Burkholderiaceae bacterium]
MSLTRRDALKTVPAAALTASIPGLALAQAGAQPRRGGTLTVHMQGEQRILNPALRASTGVYVISGKIMEALVDLNAKGDPEPALATSWQSSADGKTITFKLRQGVNWHDGKPFTSADVQYTAMEMWKKHLNYGTALQLYLEAVDTPDAHMAVFRYSRPMPLDLMLRAMCDLGYIAPKHVYAGTNVLENPANTAPIGTGPFKFSKYERGQYVIAVRNDAYWRKGFPYLDQIVWRFIPDPAAAVAAIESGQIQMSAEGGLPLADLDRLKKNSAFEVSSRGNEGNAVMNTIEFNFRRKEIADHRVREAIVRALDVQFFCDNFLYGFAKPAFGPIPSSAPRFFPKDMPRPAFDRKKAEALLDEAGYKRGSDGRRFTLRLLPAPWGEDITLWTTFMQQSLQQVGIGIEIVRHDAAGYLSNVYKDWNFDLATGWHQFRGDPAVSTTVWYRSGSAKGSPWTNQWGWQSAEVDTLIDNAAFEIDPAKRRGLYADWVRKVNAEIPLWMATERLLISVTSNKLQNHHNQPRWISSTWHDLWLAA